MATKSSTSASRTNMMAAWEPVCPYRWFWRRRCAIATIRRSMHYLHGTRSDDAVAFPSAPLHCVLFAERLQKADGHLCSGNSQVTWTGAPSSFGIHVTALQTSHADYQNSIPEPLCNIHVPRHRSRPCLLPYHFVTSYQHMFLRVFFVHFTLPLFRFRSQRYAGVGILSHRRHLGCSSLSEVSLCRWSSLAFLHHAEITKFTAATT